ncbi:MAG: DNA cytosine methyltransferase [Verrucomicrobia bacterium]|nr:DNA cytosine methyltransferase [Verrucomicrobiota bacterium]
MSTKTKLNGHARKQTPTASKASPEVWSFFSGAMGLDLGLEMAGVHPTLAVEIDSWCCATVRRNRPSLTLVEGDVTKMTGAELRELRGCSGEVELVVGGPPCQSFSPGGKRAALSDPRGNLIYEYFRLISEIRPRYFVMENVANLITAALNHRPIKDRPGKHWNLRAYSNGRPLAEDGVAPLEDDELSGSAIRQILNDVQGLNYHVTFGVLDAADLGAPQHRLRFVMFGARDGFPPALPTPTHGDGVRGLLPFRTVRDAIWDIRLNPGPHSSYTEDMAAYFALIPPGGTWRNLPIELQKSGLGPAYESGGGKTGFFRRLDYDGLSPTVTTKPNRKGSAMCHPEFVRPISVWECARLQGFPDDWIIEGPMNQQYQQIGNAVPTYLGKAIGEKFLPLLQTAADDAVVPAPRLEHMLEVASARLRRAACNKRGRNSTPDLFGQLA